jgi:hypothetical protein
MIGEPAMARSMNTTALFPVIGGWKSGKKEAIIDYFIEHPTEGYRRLTYMMIDEEVFVASAYSVYRVLSSAGLLGKRHLKPSLKGKDFHQPLRAHEHWYTDVTYLNPGRTFYYICSVLYGFS